MGYEPWLGFYSRLCTGSHMPLSIKVASSRLASAVAGLKDLVSRPIFNCSGRMSSFVCLQIRYKTWKVSFSDELLNS